MPKRNNESLWAAQHHALRDPAEVLCGAFETDGVAPESLHAKSTPSFTNLLKKLGVTLFVTREYEHLALALTSEANKIRQSFVHLPHPSGLVVDRAKKKVYIAATRNPNQVWEFSPLAGMMARKDCKPPRNAGSVLMPTRTVVLPGATYLHDLALIGGKLHGNSVGQNAVIQISFDGNGSEIVWTPKNVTHDRNYLQLNSIAAGKTVRDSFFSASGEAPLRYRPGHLNYPVDKQGVIFSGKTRTVIGRGLTRPHSARLHQGKLWVDNSGYGEFGWIENGTFHPLIKLPGWTRGLCLIDNVAFVGVSRVLPKFARYAPGLKPSDKQCGIYAVDLKTGKILGSILWPAGNQIFAIDWIKQSITPGFPFHHVAPTDEATKCLFYAGLTRTPLSS